MSRYEAFCSVHPEMRSKELWLLETMSEPIVTIGDTQ